ncbi:MAG: hypothetical protein QOD99_2989 [Chthoniobacter sp.]|jgi:exosortase|nr:hypothetical protein [Chthoniobacter sp.]
MEKVSSPAGNPSAAVWLSRLGRWFVENPAPAVLFSTLAATFFYFFCVFKLDGALPVGHWAWLRWSPGYDMEHGKFVPLITLFLVWYHRDALWSAPKGGSNMGLGFVALGVVFFILATRCVQPRVALGAVPFLLFGSVYYVWGWKTARILLFPLAFLIFMIPVAALEQATFRLQFIITAAVKMLATVGGIGVQSIGTTLVATDQSFNFEIAEGCSGVRSLTAMTMLAAIFVHLTQNRLWKKGTIFAFSAVFAIIGNIGRIFTVILVAKFYDPKIAGGIYHDYSGYVFFPIAVAAMLGFSKLVNTDLDSLKSDGRKALEKENISYDY